MGLIRILFVKKCAKDNSSKVDKKSVKVDKKKVYEENQGCQCFEQNLFLTVEAYLLFHLK